MEGDQQKGLSEEWTKERHRRKRTREGSSLTDEEDCPEVREHACQRCCDANARLDSIEDKLSTLLQILPVHYIQEKIKRSRAKKTKARMLKICKSK